MTDQPAGDTTDVRGVQVTALALLAGLAVFSGIAIFLGGQGRGDGTPIASLIMGGFAAMDVAAAMIIPARMQPASRRYEDLLGIWRGRTIIRLAALQGAALANLVGYLIEGKWWSLAIVGTVVLLMLANFPTATRLKHFVEAEQAFG